MGDRDIVMGDRDIVPLAGELVSIESVNPAFPGGGRGEVAVAQFVADDCRRLALDVERQPVVPAEGETPMRENVLESLSLPGPRPTLLFEARMDTVALDASGSMRHGGLAADARGGRLYGRGACDTKGALAAMLAALETLIAWRREPGVNVALAL